MNKLYVRCGDDILITFSFKTESISKVDQQYDDVLHHMTLDRLGTPPASSIIRAACHRSSAVRSTWQPPQGHAQSSTSELATGTLQFVTANTSFSNAVLIVYDNLRRIARK